MKKFKKESRDVESSFEENSSDEEVRKYFRQIGLFFTLLISSFSFVKPFVKESSSLASI